MNIKGKVFYGQDISREEESNTPFVDVDYQLLAVMLLKQNYFSSKS